MKFGTNNLKLFGVITLGVLAIFASVFVTASNASEEKMVSGFEAEVAHLPPQQTDELPEFLNFPTPFSSDIPGDVDEELVQELIDAQFPQAQRLFDIHSWQLFIALNWPVDEEGNPQPNLTDEGISRVATWREAYEIFQADGSAPVPWGDPRQPPGVCGQTPAEGSRVIYRTNKLSSVKLADVLDEHVQAFTFPLWDQNGNEVRYEVFVNEDEYNYILETRIYNLDGQIEFAQDNPHQKLDFPAGSLDGAIGAIEVKMAWKVIDEQAGDIPSRFFTVEALVLNDDGSCSEELMGLVGMHISHKTESSPQWIWSTFEHVDNVRVNDLLEVDGEPLTPSFNDPSCEICPVNVVPTPDADGLLRTQVTRVVPIPKATNALNQQVQALLEVEDSPYQYYELVNTQWPTDPSAPPSPASPNRSSLPDGVTNKSGGRPAPVYLINTTMETYLQTGNETAQFQEQGFPFNDTPIFGTESCMGCHSSAGFAVDYIEDAEGTRTAIFGGQLSADFSWLPQIKAHWDTTQ